MRALKVKREETEDILRALKRTDSLAQAYKIDHDQSYTYIPLQKNPPAAILKKCAIVQHPCKKREQPQNLRDALQPLLSEKALTKLRTSMDLVGTIAIIEIDDDLQKKEKIIAQTLLRINKNTSTVLKKVGGHTGSYRLQKYKYLAGKKTKETIHKENGVRMQLHVEKTYFSPRLATERLRIAHQIQKKENILVMFSGMGAYPLVIARNSPAKKITAIEINPDACAYAKKNVHLNKFTNIKLYCGDVKKVLPKLRKKYDRILLPLPKDAQDYLPLALAASKRGTIIHLYAFVQEENLAQAQKQLIQKHSSLILLRAVLCGQVRPREYRVCYDLKKA